MPRPALVSAKTARSLKKMYTKKTKRRMVRMPSYVVRRAGIPERMNVALSYNFGQIGTTTSTTPGTYTINPTNLYDLLNDSTYKQPRFFDQLAAMYNRYRVNAFKWEVEFAALTGTSYLAVGQLPHDVTVATNSLKAFQEDPRFKIYITSLNKGPIKRKGFRTIASIEDVPKSVVRTDDAYNAETTASVTYKPTLQLKWQGLDETASYGHWIQGHIICYAIFYQVKQPSAS